MLQYCRNIFLFFNIISLIFHRNFNGKLMKEPENIIHSMSEVLREEESSREGLSTATRGGLRRLLSLETLPDITVYHCWNEDRTILFSCSGFFCHSPQKSSTHNIHCLYSQIRCGEARHTHRSFSRRAHCVDWLLC